MAGTQSNGAGALVKSYDPNRNGASYVLKLMHEPEGDWDFGKLHLFFPMPSAEMLGKRMRRHLRRHPALLQKCMESQVPVDEGC